MPNPYQKQYEDSYYAKMRTMGVKESPCPREVAHNRYPPVAAQQGDPAVEVREGRILTGGPAEMAKHLNSPREEPAIPPRTAEFKKE